MNILFLDDNLTRAIIFKTYFPRAVWVDNVRECISQINAREWDYVFLDHDLNEIIKPEDYAEEDKGMEVVRYLCANKMPIKNIWVHSTNIYASSDMHRDLSNSGYRVTRIPFTLIDYSAIIE